MVIKLVLANWINNTTVKTGSINTTFTATVLAIVMHLAGALGMLFGRRDWFLVLTPFNLLIMFFLMIWTLPEKSFRLYIFFILAFMIGISTEMIGVKTGLLFGNYHYGDTLGFKINGAPVLIGINWFIIIYASGMLSIQLANYISMKIPLQSSFLNKFWPQSILIIIGAGLATLFDIIMEPAAVKLGFWSWDNGQVPLLNYFSWFFLSSLILFFFRYTSPKPHPFAINLLIIQALFFLVLR
jgi:bisanhydrobacterioruberin hydratase